MKEGVSRIKNGMALERSFSASGRANDGALAAGEYRIAKELMDTVSTCLLYTSDAADEG